MKLALPNATGDIFLLADEMLATGIAESRTSPRRRMILPVHREQEDLVQRMFNFFQLGTYIPPHMHPRDYASESIFVIQGRLGFLHLEEDGQVISTTALPAGAFIDIVPRLWHSMVALEEDTVVLEIKRGPYDDTDKVFPDWAPEEGTPEAEKLMKEYEARFKAE